MREDISYRKGVADMTFFANKVLNIVVNLLALAVAVWLIVWLVRMFT